MGAGVRLGGGGGAQAELLEPGAELLEAAAHAGRKHSEVGAADREHPAVEVLALALERSREAIEDVRVGVVELVQAHQVDREPGRAVEGTRTAGVDEADLAVDSRGSSWSAGTS